MTGQTVYIGCMPTSMEVTPQGRYEYLLKTPFPLRDRIRQVATQYNISFNAALNILLDEALTARGLPKDS